MSVIDTLLKRSRNAPSNARGCLDHVESGWVKGWAFDPDHPDTRLSVELHMDGQPLQTVLADQFREDLLNAGMGDGVHGFRVPLDRRWMDGRAHVLEAWISDGKGAGRTVLQNSPLTSVLQSAPEVPGSEPTEQVLAPDAALASLSVVIPTRNRAGEMERNVTALVEAAAHLSVEFVVIDDGSTDDTPERLRGLANRFANLRWSSLPQGGFGQARNAGVAMASNELVLFLADDIRIANGDFFQHHLSTHRMLPAIRVGVLGKITWPNAAQERVSFLMAHIQGAGQQQFGFYNLLPYTWLDWRFFYTSNVSFKKSVIADWMSGGFAPRFANGLSEDAELGYRIDRGLTGGLQILYCPAAAATHGQQGGVRDFIERQIAAGRAGRAFTRVHPEAAQKLGMDRVDALLASPVEGDGATEDLLKMMEGAKAWGVVIEGRYHLGSQNWHADLLSAIFELSYLQGYVMAYGEGGANYAAAYQYALERFQEKMSTAASFEVFGRFPSFTLT